MLNCNKRSITVNMKNPKGKEVFDAAAEEMRRAGRELRPGRARPAWASRGSACTQLNPRIVVASVKGFGPGPYADCKVVRERRAVRWAAACVTTGLRRRPAARHRRADRRFGHRPAPGARHRRGAYQRNDDGPRPVRARGDAGRRAEPVPRQVARPAAPRSHARMEEYPQYPNGSSSTPCRAPATLRAAASPAGSSSARAGRPTRTRTSTSSCRRRCGRTSAT